MYDNVNFRVDGAASDRILKLLAENRAGTTFQTDQAGNLRKCFGHIGNMQVRIYEIWFSVSGSLAKYYLGNNFDTLNLQMTRSAVRQLGQQLDLDLDQARMSSIEFGASMIVNRPISAYCDLLGGCRGYERIHYDNGGICYRNRNRSLTIYDKIKETKHSRGKIPPGFDNCHVLRIEIKYKNRLEKQLKARQVLGSSLYDPRFYRALILRWESSYFQIRRINRVTVDLSAFTDVRHLSQALASFGLMQIGLSEALAIVAEYRKSFTRVQYARLRAKLVELSTNPGLITPSKAILELDDKVRQNRRFTEATGGIILCRKTDH